MKFSNFIIALTTLTQSIFGVSYHAYDKDAEILEKNPVFCGILASHMDLTRITAVKNLQRGQCGTCLKVTYEGKEVYVMAVDQGGDGLDLNPQSFSYLAGGLEKGIIDAKYEPANQSHCAGIINKDIYDFPALRNTPSAENPQKVEADPNPPSPIPIVPKEDKQVIAHEQETSDSSKENPSNQSPHEPNNEVPNTPMSQKCLDDRTYVIEYPGGKSEMKCGDGTKCTEKDGYVFCL